jgi:anti-sigma28 factor (negative regulator of flagellin synthesis)
MRMDDVSRLPQSQTTERAQPTNSQHSPGQSSGDAIEDHAEISSLAQALEGADRKRLDALRLQVESGEYTVSASELAGRIIDAHTKLS